MANKKTESAAGGAEKDIAKLSIEQALAALEEVLDKMQDEETTLEESFACYEYGMKLLKHCNATIDRVEKRVQQISEDGEVTEFD